MIEVISMKAICLVDIEAMLSAAEVEQLRSEIDRVVSYDCHAMALMPVEVALELLHEINPGVAIKVNRIALMRNASSVAVNA
jgi:hypothetical protein